MNHSGSNTRHCSRTRRRKQLLRLLLRKTKRRLKVERRRCFGTTEDRRIHSFRTWCAKVGLQLHPKITIGRSGSCSEIGVVAADDISKGECLAVIPRRVLLSCSNSDIAGLVADDLSIMTPTTSSWVPLLLALAAECSKKESGFWCHYLSLVPNSKECSSPVLWAESERHRLLEGTGLERRVERDLSRIKQDFNEFALPFMQKHERYFSASVQSMPNYLKLVAMVMSYSFTDGAESDFLSQTMMVPFVDLLNHHSHHHVELKFTKSSLRLMVVRDIKKGEEVMNTYGHLSNVSLMQSYGFAEVDNPYDEALVSVDDLKKVFVGNSSVSGTRQERWAAVEGQDILEDEYTVSCSGKPCSALLQAVHLLHAEECVYSSSTQSCQFDIKFRDLNTKEKSLLRRLAEHCLSKFPDNFEEVLSCTSLDTSRSKKEQQTLILSRGLQNCLRALIGRLQ